MTDQQGNGQNSNVGAGWYPNPDGTGGQRWWDGSAWGSQTQPAQGQPATAQPAFPSQPAYQGGQPAAYGSAPAQVPPGTRATSPFAWVIALLPLVSVALSFTYDGRDEIDRSLEQATDPSTMPTFEAFTSGNPWLQALSFLIIAITVVAALLDWRLLRRRGVDRPFHWAWSFFSFFGAVGSLVYLIGRTVILKRRGAPDPWPMWAGIAVAVITVVVTIVQVVSLVGYAFDRMGTF